MLKRFPTRRLPIRRCEGGRPDIEVRPNRSRRRVRVPILALLAAVSVVALAGAGAQHRVSQKGRAFAPAAIVIRSGDAIAFMNDDGDLLHHAYLDSDRFSFDTGDQEPGSKAVVTFPTKGTFTVLCGIHPKMKLVVQVQ